MSATRIDHDVTLWMVNEVPARMFYGGRRWTVTDMPTRLRESIWAVPLEERRGLYGWRFQATDPDGQSLVFDVYRDAEHWHVHHTWS